MGSTVSCWHLGIIWERTRSSAPSPSLLLLPAPRAGLCAGRSDLGCFPISCSCPPGLQGSAGLPEVSWDAAHTLLQAGCRKYRAELSPRAAAWSRAWGRVVFAAWEGAPVPLMFDFLLLWFNLWGSFQLFTCDFCAQFWTQLVIWRVTV